MAKIAPLHVAPPASALKMAREAAGLTQQGLASAAGVAISTVSMIERSGDALLTHRLAQKLNAALATASRTTTRSPTP